MACGAGNVLGRLLHVDPSFLLLVASLLERFMLWSQLFGPLGLLCQLLGPMGNLFGDLGRFACVAIGQIGGRVRRIERRQFFLLEGLARLFGFLALFFRSIQGPLCPLEFFLLAATALVGFLRSPLGGRVLGIAVKRLPLTIGVVLGRLCIPFFATDLLLGTLLVPLAVAHAISGLPLHLLVEALLAVLKSPLMIRPLLFVAVDVLILGLGGGLFSLPKLGGGLPRPARPFAVLVREARQGPCRDRLFPPGTPLATTCLLPR